VVTVDSKEHPLDVPSAQTRQTAQVFENTNYLLYLPEEYNKDEKRWPSILYLHGESLRGDNVEMLKGYGLAALLEKDLKVAFVVVSPQCPADRFWMTEDETLIRLLDHIVSTYAIDPERSMLRVTAWAGAARGYLPTNIQKSLLR